MHRIAQGKCQAPVTVELEEALCGAVAHDVAATDRRALLEHHHVEPHARERVGRDGSARSGAHHHHVGDDLGIGHLGIPDHRQVNGRRRPGRTQRHQRLAVIADESGYLWMGGVGELDQSFEPGQGSASRPEPGAAAGLHPSVPAIGIQPVVQPRRAPQQRRQVEAEQHRPHQPAGLAAQGAEECFYVPGDTEVRGTRWDGPTWGQQSVAQGAEHPALVPAQRHEAVPVVVTGDGHGPPA